MGALEDLVDREACVRLGFRYARAVDTGDAVGLAGVFHDDGRLVVYGEAGDERAVLVGNEHLARSIGRGNRGFVRTHHAVSNALVDLDGDRATGTSCCVARHLSRGAGVAASLVMVIDYEDTYERRDGTWRILERHVLNRWHETVTALTPTQAAVGLVPDRHLASTVARLTAIAEAGGTPADQGGGQAP